MNVYFRILIALTRLSGRIHRKLIMATISQVQTQATNQSTSLDALLPVVTALAASQVPQAQIDALSATLTTNDQKIAAIAQAATNPPAPANP
jgi:hypothetical protein